MGKKSNENSTDNNVTPEELRELSDWRNLADGIPEFITNLTPEGTILFVNKTFSNINKEKIIGKNIFDFYRPEQKQKLKYNIKQALNSKNPIEYESEILTLEGNRIILFNRIVAIAGPDNKKILNIISKDVTKMFSEVQYSSGDESKKNVPREGKNRIVSSLGGITEIKDLSEQEILENTLKRIASEWNKTFDTLNDSVALLDIEGNVIRCNRALLKLTDLSFKEVLGKYICTLMKKKIRNFEGCLFENIKNSNKREERILQIGDLWFRSIMEPMILEQGKLTGAVHVLTDITEMKKKEIILEEQKNFFQLSIDSLTHPFYVIDINTYQIVMKNKSTDILFPNKGKTCFSKTHKRRNKCSKEHKCPIDFIRRTGKPFISIHYHTSVYNEEKIFETHSFPILDRSGNIIQIILYSIDITDRKKGEEEAAKQKEILYHADKMIRLGILVSGVAHEINNPNNAIRLHSSILKKSISDIIPILDDYYSKNISLEIAGFNYSDFKEEIVNIINGIKLNSDRIKTIVNELKSYSGKEHSRFTDPVDINIVIKSAIDLLGGMIKDSTDNLIISLKNNLPVISGNFRKLEQVIINIIQNACQALTSKKNSISISTSVCEESKSIIIEVVDEGKGIEEKDRKFITDPFFTTKRDIGGTGLGLSVSEKIIKSHGGAIDFSFIKNKNTRVKILLPIEKSTISGEK
ncbi:MAG: PAS domain-containing protein [Acidobacteriota bacterium]